MKSNRSVTSYRSIDATVDLKCRRIYNTTVNNNDCRMSKKKKPYINDDATKSLRVYFQSGTKQIIYQISYKVDLIFTVQT